VGISPSGETDVPSTYDEVGESPKILPEVSSDQNVGVSGVLDQISCPNAEGTDQIQNGDSGAGAAATSRLDNGDPSSGTGTHLESAESSAMNQEHSVKNCEGSLDSGISSLSTEQEQPAELSSGSSPSAGKPVVHVLPNAHLFPPQSGGGIQSIQETTVKQIVKAPSTDEIGSAEGPEDVYNNRNQTPQETNTNLNSNPGEAGSPVISVNSSSTDGDFHSWRSALVTAGLVISCSILAMVVIRKYSTK
jgi:hypothetical protein